MKPSPRVPSRTHYDPVVDAFLHTGVNVQDRVHDMPTGTTVAIDTETESKHDPFSTKCLTAAWEVDGLTHSILLDPLRNATDRAVTIDLLKRAGTLVLHNAPFDIAPIYTHGLMDLAAINRVVDTLLLARMAFTLPPPFGRAKTLEALASRELGWYETKGGMERAFKAAGYKKQEHGWRDMDIDSPIYRQGAMFDTIATLKLEPLMRRAAEDQQLDHPFVEYGVQRRSEARELVDVQETVHRVMMRRSSRGLSVDRDYINVYGESVDIERNMAEAELAVHGLEGGVGKQAALVQYLYDHGELPLPWPRTPKGALRATKDLLEELAEGGNHLARSQRTLADAEKIHGYLVKVEAQAELTGFCHPQVNTLGASATGRMSYSGPELQQFPAGARPVITDTDGLGLTSIDWSQIEPVVMGCMARDEKFLAPYEAGEDLYEPLMRAANIDRDGAKVNLLATMYGQGIPGLARRTGKTQEQAAQIRRQLLSAMPRCRKWMAHTSWVAQEYGCVPTCDGRILSVDPGGTFKAVNYVVQGGAYGILANTIYVMEQRGMGDAVHLAMHDELVVRTDAAAEVREIMQTPPPFLIKCAARIPTLRTDREELGPIWTKDLWKCRCGSKSGKRVGQCWNCGAKQVAA